MRLARPTFAGLIGLGVTGTVIASLVFLLPLGREADAPEDSIVASGDADLPWPYCLPDASPPPQPEEPWPDVPPLEPGVSEWRHSFDPIVNALVEVSGLVPGEVWDGSAHAWQDVSATVQEVVWATASPDGPEEEPVAAIEEGPVRLVVDPETVVLAMQADAAGARLIVGIPHAWYGGEGDLHVDFVMEADPDAPTVLGPYPFGERDTQQLRAFLDWEGNPLRGTDPVRFLVAWNLEAEVTGAGPIEISWGRFWDRFLGDDSTPQVGTEEWWAKAPPRCRSLLDAPDGILDDLPFADVWIHVPASWRGLTDGAFCAWAQDLGSTGCIGPALATDDNPYLHFDEAHALPGKAVEVNYSKKIDGSISVALEVVIGVIPFAVFVEPGAVLVELPEVAPASYGALAANPSAYQATVRSISHEESEAIKDLIPAAEEEDCAADDEC